MLLFRYIKIPRWRVAVKQLHIKIDDQLHEHLKEYAKEKGLSMQKLILDTLNNASQTNNTSNNLVNEEQGIFKFIDLFAGIGGIRLAFEKAGGKCVFTSEWDKFCQITYKENFGEAPHGDINQIKNEDFPEYDVLLAGFPCQPFSIAGVSKKNSLGRPTGFLDKTQGTLFFQVARILQGKMESNENIERRPKAFLLENVKNLTNHDKGRTFKVICDTLEELEYKIFTKVIDAVDYVPQHRERIFIVGFDKRVYGDDITFSFPEKAEGLKPAMKDILEQSVDSKYTLSDHLWNYLQEYAKRHKEKGNGFGFGLVDFNGYARTLSARYHKDGSEILIPQEGKNPRRLTPRECARLMGYPESYKIKVSDTQAYRQFGNSVVVSVIEPIAEKIIETMSMYKKENKECNDGCILKREA